MLKGKNKKDIGLMKSELGGKIMIELAALRPKTYSCLTDNNDENKISKSTKKCVIKRNLELEDCKHWLEVVHLEHKIIQLERNKRDVVLEKIVRNL